MSKEELVERLWEAAKRNPNVSPNDASDIVETVLAELKALGLVLVPEETLIDISNLARSLCQHPFVDECGECGVGHTDLWKKLRALPDTLVAQNEIRPQEVSPTT